MNRKNRKKVTPARKRLREKVAGKQHKRITGFNREELEKTVFAFLSANPGQVFNYKQVSHRIGVEYPPIRQQIYSIMEEMAIDHVLVRVDRGRYKYNATNRTIEGIFERRINGRNILLPIADDIPSVVIADQNALHAINGDRVRAQLFAKRRDKDLEGQVIEIIERKTYSFVGTVEIMRDIAFVATEDRRVGYDIFIPKSKLSGAKAGDKVIARISDWPMHAKNPVGEIISVLGPSGDNETEMHAILAQFSLPYSYPQNVEKAAEKLSENLSAEEVAQREDFRETLTLTIDPADAKDFDDAISFTQLEDGKYQIGVHIADVSYFVTPKSVIDREAYERATSIYLVDRTIPMLPEKLCNDLCSLKPDCDRPAYSCVFEMNEDGQVIDYRIVRTLIRSRRRFTYEEAQEIIDGNEGDCKEAILKLNELAGKLRKQRFDKGAIAFESEEVRFQLDERGKPIGVYVKENKEANWLIEEFMLLANRTVATHISQMKKASTQSKGKTFVYRIHEQPDPEKLDNLSSFIYRLGYRFKFRGKGDNVSQDINRLLSDIHGKPEESLISTIAIRTMAKARYSTDNVGHYGLAFENYTHFTSPIRRYPDLMVHRMLTHYLQGGRSLDKTKYEEDCVHCSEMEQIAAQAERESIKYKQVEYMQSRLGQVFDGVISSVAEWGVYVELNESKCEGLVPMRSLDDDFYEYDEANYCLIGRRSKKRYALGDPLSVRIASANLERRQLDFELV
ncbi:Ribonuclease R [Porphyromonas crevioricanis]|uniref:Ribonuclease R n=1 Tax=Porphyromonas crevioricanis TaxID=393921 RepID=A0A2X4PKY5_9PORP|nr:ribonuclease R [Porphyromonas crevioricanis]GAD06878.1 3'-to-5' exoribonuclease RNase R [Porphyromonas crevioricanis JCM 13913]SQH73440.1 Ribonuclease R [Porphyromonas crevioricanis]